jgi:hypothetical protein
MLHLLQDEDGRPLGEHSVRPDARELSACPYDDRRRGQPMNTAALAQVVSQWGSILPLLGAAAAQQDGTVSGMWRATAGCVLAAPQAGTPVPRALSALYKTALGLNQALLRLLLATDGLAGRPATELGAGPAFAAWCDREGLLFGREQVCAGSPGQIGAAWDALLAATPGQTPVSAGAARAFADLQALQLAMMAATYQAQRRGEVVGSVGAAILRKRPFAWLDCPPDRLPEHVGRLYAAPPSWLDGPWDDERYLAVQQELGGTLPPILRFL